MGLLQDHVNTPALCYNMIQREQHHLDRLQNTLIYYIDDKHHKSDSSESFRRITVRVSKNH